MGKTRKCRRKKACAKRAEKRRITVGSGGRRSDSSPDRVGGRGPRSGAHELMETGGSEEDEGNEAAF